MQIINGGSHLRVITTIPEGIRTAIPSSAAIVSQGEYTVFDVPWTYETAKVLTNLGYSKTPSPIERDYHWPGPYKPFNHQMHTSSFLTLNRRAFCFNEMGCGKTASVIWAVHYMMQLGLVTRVLVLAPLSILSSAWDNEIFRLNPTLKTAIAHGGKAKVTAAIKGDASMVIMNHDGVKGYNDALIGEFDLIVVDEANAFKNPASDRWKCLDRLCRNPSVGLWMMTGTPASQSPEDAFGLAKLVNPKAVPRSLYLWREMVMTKMGPFKLVPRQDAREKVFQVLQPAVRYHKKDCIDLPPVTFVTQPVTMTPQQTKYYQMMAKQMVIEIAGAQVTAGNAAAKMQKLLQIACGAAYTADDGSVMTFDASSRVNAVLDIIDATDEKVLIAVPYRNATAMLLGVLEKAYGAGSVGVINGDTTANERSRLFDEFQNADHLRILLIQPQAAAHGVTLTRASVTIWYAPTTSYELFAQMNARMDRPGQVNNMTVVQLEGCPVEVKLNAALRGRHVDSTALLDMLNEL